MSLRVGTAWLLGLIWANPSVACTDYFAQLDNDFTTLQDEGYSNGGRIGCGWALTGGHGGAIELSLGHSIHTPANLARRTLDTADQPYVGHLFAQGAWHWQDERALTRLDAQLGVVGPAAGGEPVQKLIHAIGQFAEPRGWRHQLGNEVTLNGRAGRIWRIELHRDDRSASLLPFGWAAAGSMLTAAGAGGLLQFGHYSEPVYPRFTGSSEPPGPAVSGMRHGEYVLFAGIDGRWVAHDLTLDGNLFSNSHSVSKKRAIGALRLGVQTAWRGFEFGFVQTLHSALFDGDDPHGYGSFFVAVGF